MAKIYNPTKAGAAQMEYCKTKGYPHFAPSRGICYRCHKNIYEEIVHDRGERTYSTGIDVERAGSELITGCPHCCWSYCD